MNKLMITALVISAINLSSCGGNDAPVKDTSIMPAQDTVKSMSPSVNSLPGGNSAPIVLPAANGTQQVPANQGPAISAGAGLNPEHGMPGHRCDISVGAPLNSPPGNSSKPTVQTTTAAPAPAPVMAPAPAASSAPTPGVTGKVNPPHGQPGHDCAIAVGAPLKN
jgi:hypothetical protein